MTAALYLCYQSIGDPLTETQVVAYLEGLAAVGYRSVLLTFEPRRLTRDEARHWRERLSAKGIVWEWRRYHKRPTLPATAWDVAAGVLAGWRLMRRHDVRLIHARSHVAGVIGRMLKRLTGAKLLFDLRGFMAEEYADAGVWKPGGRLFRLTKRMERALVRAADGVVVLTSRARRVLAEWYADELRGKPVEVIPCCVDLRRIPPPGSRRTDCQSVRDPDDRLFVYAGKLGGWYPTERIAAFVAESIRTMPGTRWQIWTQSDPELIRTALESQGLNGEVAVGRCDPDVLAGELRRADAGLSFITPCFSKLASSPTKLAEYLAAGLPVVTTAGIGDIDEIVSGHTASGHTAGSNPDRSAGPVGVVIREDTPEGHRRALAELRELLSDGETPARCRAVAEERFDLQRVGWARYRRLYDRLCHETAGSAVTDIEHGRRHDA